MLPEGDFGGFARTLSRMGMEERTYFIKGLLFSSLLDVPRTVRLDVRIHEEK
jgi:hypothetical protein